ncbi:MAG: hypothetical protein Fur0021_35730 [Candidatus Promineifilaceae bacterium]
MDRRCQGNSAATLAKAWGTTPSGYIKYDDDFLTTAVREVGEETGLDDFHERWLRRKLSRTVRYGA